MPTVSSSDIKDVNIPFGDKISRLLYETSKATQKNRPGFVNDIDGTFSGFRDIEFNYFAPYFSQLVFYPCCDGVGTKIEINERTEDFTTTAYDLLAMIADDTAVRGAEILGFCNVLDVRQLEETEKTYRSIAQLMDGLEQAAAKAEVAILNGELAELGDRVGGYGPFNVNWSATGLWFGNKARILTGAKIEAGDAIVGLAEPGFRSNGITDVRKAMLENYGPKWHNKVIPALDPNQTLGQLVALPSTIYCRIITALNGGWDPRQEPRGEITGVAHITGGGMPSKISRMLRPTNGLGAMISDPFTPPAIMSHVQGLRGFDDRTAYGKWHMGQGMVVTTPNPEQVIKTAAEFGVLAEQIGVITNTGLIEIRSKGLECPGQILAREIMA